jgi:hypothetical protein
MMNSETTSEEESVGARIISMLARFPNDRILSDPTLERRIMNLVWIVVPLQYYLFTRLSGGMRGDEWFSIALTVLMCIFLVLGVSAVVALIPSIAPRLNYVTRLRAWSLALITNWAVAVCLLALSYLIGSICGIGTNDLLHTLVCGPGLPFKCANYPDFSPGTYGIYLGYSVLAVAIVFVAILIVPVKEGPMVTRLPSPLTFLVPLLTAAILTVLYSSTKLT